MNCPYCSSYVTTRLARNTSLGYPTFHCSQCKSKFNERTGTVYNHLQFPTDIVLLVVLWRLRYKQGSSMRARRDLAGYPLGDVSGEGIRIQQGSSMRSRPYVIGNGDSPH